MTADPTAATSGKIIESDEMRDVQEFLDGDSVAAVAIEPGYLENGHVTPVDEGTLYIGPADKLQGEFWHLNETDTQHLVESFSEELPAKIGPEERNDAGFYIGNRAGNQYEIKLDETLPVYPEWPPHTHNVNEEYVPLEGSINMGLPGPEFPTEPEEAAEILNGIEDPSKENMEESYPGLFVYENIDQPFTVPAGVPHYVEDAEDSTSLIIARGDSEETVERAVPHEPDFWRTNYTGIESYEGDTPMTGYEPQQYENPTKITED